MTPRELLKNYVKRVTRQNMRIGHKASSFRERVTNYGRLSMR